MSGNWQKEVPTGESPAAVKFTADVTGGDGYRVLWEKEKKQLKNSLDKFSEESTKISPQEIEFKKDLVKWLVQCLRKELGGFLFRTFNTGSAYEKVQAGEAKDFDIMIFLHVRKWTWKVHSDPKKPEFCWITRGAERRGDNPNSFKHLLDGDGRLSSLKVRKFFTSKIDKFLRKNNPLEFEHAPITSAASPEESESLEKEKLKVEITRKYQGPATTLMVECKGITPFTIDLVSSLHAFHINFRPEKERCDFVAKPYDKQKMFSTEYEHMWRKSYSRQESKKLRDIDSGNRVHRKLLRIFKILRMNQPQLKLLKTYIFKNLLLFMSDLEGKEWTDENIADRFVEMVIALRNCLANQMLPVYFNPKVNLLQESEYKPEKIVHVSAYLRRIANKGIEGYESLLAAAKESEVSKRKSPVLEQGEEMVNEEMAEVGQEGLAIIESQPHTQQSNSGAPKPPTKKTKRASARKNKKKEGSVAANSQLVRPKARKQKPNRNSLRNRKPENTATGLQADDPFSCLTEEDVQRLTEFFKSGWQF